MLSVASCSLRKRRNEDAENSGLKVPRGGFYFVLESESDVPSSAEDTESISSIHNKSTDFAKDTSDTCSKSSHNMSDVESLAGVEYEVVSLSEHEHDHPFNSYSSGTDSEAWKKQTQEADGNGDDDRAGENMWADGSSAANDHTTVELDKTLPLRLRKCVKCNDHTNYVQYCHQCYKVRKDFFPPRPKRCRKKSSKSAFKKKSCIKKPPKLPLDDVKNEPWGESGSSQELIPVSRDSNPSAVEGLCSVCLVNPKNGAFLHCRWVHIYSCYQCSLKIWFSTKCCPLCNNKVRQVLKVATG